MSSLTTLRALPTLAVVLFLVGLLTAPEIYARRPVRLSVHRAGIDLPGPPAQLLPADLDGDGRVDLVAVVAYTEWDQVVFDRIENAVMIAEVVPALFNRREIHVFLAGEDGSYNPAGSTLDISGGVFAVASGPSSTPVLALTDAGVAALRLGVDPETGDTRLLLETLIEEPPAFAGAETFLPSLEFTADLTGNGKPDLWIPTRDGLSIHLGEDDHLSPESSALVMLPRVQAGSERFMRLDLPLPRVADFNGDAHPDLLLHADENPGTPAHEGGDYLVAGHGDGSFDPPRKIDLSALLPDPDAIPAAEANESENTGSDAPGNTESANNSTTDSPDNADSSTADSTESDGYAKPYVAFLGDLDGDGRMEAVTKEMKLMDKGMIKGFRSAKKAPARLAFHHLDASLHAEAEPYATLETIGYEIGGGWPDVSANAFSDLDHDGRADLVTITLDFSLLGAMKAAATKRLSIGLDFHVWRQQENGSFLPVRGLDLSEKLKLNLSHLKFGRMAQFAGDFDGDGRIDFVHFGRGSTITIHRGQEGAKYSKKPDLAIKLEREPDAIELVHVLDLDRNGRADLAITMPKKAEDPEATAPVHIEIYLVEGE